MDEAGLVPFLEAIYAIELDDETWLTGALPAMTERCGPEHHYVGYFYDASDVNRLNVWNIGATETSPHLVEAFRIW
ncbi:MAG TPA: hypothetical protein VK524_07425 [Polyangiaceae bacterium]|nr:hypothetical protein [Polyangiaceae bacterium]